MLTGTPFLRKALIELGSFVYFGITFPFKLFLKQKPALKLIYTENKCIVNETALNFRIELPDQKYFDEI